MAGSPLYLADSNILLCLTNAIASISTSRCFQRG